MATFFVLGPSEWVETGKTQSLGFDPLEQRKAIVALLKDIGHRAFIMRDIKRNEDDLSKKFLSVLEKEKPTHCLIYWPAEATMDTTEDELFALRLLVAQGTKVPEVWVMAQDIAAQEINGEVHVLDDIGRSTYIRDFLRKVPSFLVNWCNHEDLENQISNQARAIMD